MRSMRERKKKERYIYKFKREDGLPRRETSEDTYLRLRYRLISKTENSSEYCMFYGRGKNIKI